MGFAYEFLGDAVFLSDFWRKEFQSNQSILCRFGWLARGGVHILG
jgi:hypothetical protein